MSAFFLGVLRGDEAFSMTFSSQTNWLNDDTRGQFDLHVEASVTIGTSYLNLNAGALLSGLFNLFPDVGHRTLLSSSRFLRPSLFPILWAVIEQMHVLRVQLYN